MRRALCAAPGLSGLRLLQGPPSLERHSGRVKFLVFSFKFLGGESARRLF
jgi:hypothetical protein